MSFRRSKNLKFIICTFFSFFFKILRRKLLYFFIDIILHKFFFIFSKFRQLRFIINAANYKKKKLIKLKRLNFDESRISRFAFSE